MMPEQKNQELPSPESKKVQLYLKQKALLDIFLQKGAISKAQYGKSLGDLTEKMGMQKYAGMGTGPAPASGYSCRYKEK